MKRILFASAVAMTLGFASNANAQYNYGYQTYVPGGVVGTQTYVTPFAAQTTNSFYSPYTGYSTRQSYSTNVWGNQSYRTRVYNGYANVGYRNNFYSTPYGNYNRSGFYRRW